MRAAIEEGFLADIIENPKDDTPRVIYADWLVEHGETERAEFIRVQCELAKPCWLGYSDDFHVEEWCPECDPLHDRERELIGLHGHKWAREGLNEHWGYDAEALYYWEDLQHGWVSNPMPVVFRRGFVAEITCTLADWCGVECGWCAGRGTEQLDETAYWSEAPRTTCRKCHGTGRIGGHGPALYHAAPLERVTLTDCSPEGVNRTVWAKSRLQPLWQYLQPDTLRVTARFASTQAALDARSIACLDWAKSWNCSKR